MSTKLTNLKVNEVSLVSSGANGEVFHVIKAEHQNPEIVASLSEENNSTVLNKLQSLPEEGFMQIVTDMVNSYLCINKKDGGNEMEEQILQAIEKTLEPVNKNFKALKDEIENISKKLGDVEKKTEELEKSKTAEEDADAKKAEAEKVKKSEEDAKKAQEEKDEKIAKSLDGIVETVTKAIATMGDVTKSISETVEKVSKSVDELGEKVQQIEKAPVASNDVSGNVDVKKSAGNSSLWPSFINQQ